MLTKIFPFLGWLQNYSVSALRIDALSGLTVALVLIPQSMAYAQLAGLPAYYGLYASFLPPMVASLFGSSRQLATGPVAVVSLMTSASLEPLATSGSQGYIVYAVLLALMVGLFQLSLGLLRLGLVVNFLSHPVVNGFTNAATIIIASSRFPRCSACMWTRGPTTTTPSGGHAGGLSLHPPADAAHGRPCVRSHVTIPVRRPDFALPPAGSLPIEAGDKFCGNEPNVTSAGVFDREEG